MIGTLLNGGKDRLNASSKGLRHLGNRHAGTLAGERENGIMNSGRQRIQIKGRRACQRQRRLFKPLDGSFQLGCRLCLTSSTSSLISLVMARLMAYFLTRGAAFGKTALILSL